MWETHPFDGSIVRTSQRLSLGVVVIFSSLLTTDTVYFIWIFFFLMYRQQQGYLAGSDPSLPEAMIGPRSFRRTGAKFDHRRNGRFVLYSS